MLEWQQTKQKQREKEKKQKATKRKRKKIQNDVEQSKRSPMRETKVSVLQMIAERRFQAVHQQLSKK